MEEDLAERNLSTGTRLVLECEALDDAGSGIATADGHAVHVAGLIPGERGTVVIEHVSSHRRQAWARLEARRGLPSPARVEPSCPGFGRCGGCSWQMLAYPAQCTHKRQRVVEALAAAGVHCDVDQVIASPTESGYRNKGKYVVGMRNGELALGAWAPRTHAFVDTLGCRVVTPAIDAAAARLRTHLAAQPLTVYDERQRRGQLRYAILRAGIDEALLVVLVTTSHTPRAPLLAVARAMLEDGAAGVVWMRNDTTGGAILADDVELLAGRATVTDVVAGVPVDVGAKDFLQVHRSQAERLYDDVAALAGVTPGALAIDLYCGVGGFAFALARRGARVIGIERVGDAVAAGNRAAAAAGLSERVELRVGDAASLATLPKASLIVVDPPRKGLDAATRAALADHRPPALLYVSCGPDALGRDLAVFVAAGYQLERVRPYDLMPGTAHIETVALLRRPSK